MNWQCRNGLQLADALFKLKNVESFYPFREILKLIVKFSKMGVEGLRNCIERRYEQLKNKLISKGHRFDNLYLDMEQIIIDVRRKNPNVDELSQISLIVDYIEVKIKQCFQ